MAALAQWDDVAPISAGAQQLCRQMAAWAAAERMPACIPSSSRDVRALAPRAARAALWRAHAALAAEADAERTEGALDALGSLGSLRELDGLCADALICVQRASSCLELVAQRHASLETQSAALQQQTRAHSDALAGLHSLADALEGRLGPFRALATHRRLLEIPGLSATHPDLLPALEALDRAIADLSTSASAARDSAALLAELRGLQASGLRAIAAHVSSGVHAAATAATVALREWAAEPPPPLLPGGEPQPHAPLLTPSDGAFAQAAHVRFHAAAAALRPWLEQLERRAPLHREAAAVLVDVHNAYLAARAPLARAALGAMLSRLSASLSASATAGAGGEGVATAAVDAAGAPAPGPAVTEGAASAAALTRAAARLSAEHLADAARRAIGWFARVAALERELHASFFRVGGALVRGGGAHAAVVPAAAAAAAHGLAGALDAALEHSLTGVCAVFSEWLRPAVLGADSVSGLADLALALREEAAGAGALGEPDASPATPDAPLHGAAAPPAAGSLALAIVRTLGDVQGRLAFRAQLDVRDRVRTFRPSAADLDYPEMLVRARDAAGAKARAGAGADGAGAGAAGAGAARAAQYEVPWYPPVEVALRCLAVLYRAVDRLTFSSIAAEAVAEATATLLDGARRIGALSGELHGRLFLVKQLLTLREQLAPFDADWEVVEKTLDLSSTKGWLLAEIRSRRALARPLAFVRALLTSNRPAVVESHKARSTRARVRVRSRACRLALRRRAPPLTRASRRARAPRARRTRKRASRPS